MQSVRAYTHISKLLGRRGIYRIYRAATSLDLKS